MGDILAAVDWQGELRLPNKGLIFGTPAHSKAGLLQIQPAGALVILFFGALIVGTCMLVVRNRMFSSQVREAKRAVQEQGLQLDVDRYDFGDSIALECGAGCALLVIAVVLFELLSSLRSFFGFETEMEGLAFAVMADFGIVLLLAFAIGVYHVGRKSKKLSRALEEARASVSRPERSD